MGGVPPYLVLLRVGFALPAALLPRRCALTAPFHPYPAHSVSYFSAQTEPTEWAGRYVFCGTFRRMMASIPRNRRKETASSRTLSGTLLCGVRTFLPAHSVSYFSAESELTEWAGRPSGPAAYESIIAKPPPTSEFSPRSEPERMTIAGENRARIFRQMGRNGLHC
jgi:hypothetical protein